METRTATVKLPNSSVTFELTDEQIRGWLEAGEHRGPLVRGILDLIEQHGSEQVSIALGLAYVFDLWRRQHPERWEAMQQQAREAGS